MQRFKSMEKIVKKKTKNIKFNGREKEIKQSTI
jgi:hypothetical protein